MIELIMVAGGSRGSRVVRGLHDLETTICARCCGSVLDVNLAHHIITVGRCTGSSL